MLLLTSGDHRESSLVKSSLPFPGKGKDGWLAGIGEKKMLERRFFWLPPWFPRFLQCPESVGEP